MPTKIVRILFALSALIFAQSALGQPRTYGSQLMTPQERLEHRAKMRSLSPAERQRYQAEHHADMQKRAEERGLTLPPMGARSGPRYGRGPGMGVGPGQAYDPGTGYGPGYRRGRGYGPGFGYGPGPGFGPGWGYGPGGGYGPGWGPGPGGGYGPGPW